MAQSAQRLSRLYAERALYTYKGQFKLLERGKAKGRKEVACEGRGGGREGSTTVIKVPDIRPWTQDTWSQRGLTFSCKTDHTHNGQYGRARTQ